MRRGENLSEYQEHCAILNCSCVKCNGDFDAK